MSETMMPDRSDRPARSQLEAMRRRVSERVNPDGDYQPLWPDEEGEGPAATDD